jgi:hypothetical protein
MIEMKYSNERIESILLNLGEHEGFRYYVISLGTHPCAYVEIPSDHAFFGMDYDEIYKHIYIDCHGGLTYSKESLKVGNTWIHGWFIGWDYAHYGDYCGYDSWQPNDFGMRAYTTNEMTQDCEKVIEQIMNIKLCDVCVGQCGLDEEDKVRCINLKRGE